MSTRRDLLASAAAIVGSACAPHIAGAQAGNTRLILLGTGGGPRARIASSALYDAAAVDRLIAAVPNAARLKDSILSHHTTAEDAGRVAQRAGVGTLVLSHLIPTEDPLVTEQMWIDAASKHFRGTIVVGKDLLEI